MTKNALMVATVGCFFGFERNDIKILQSMGYEVHCASNFLDTLFGDFKADGIVKHQIDFARSPLTKTNLLAYREMKKLMSEIHFDLVHCHTPMGGVIARIVARKYRKKGTKVFYTAHGFHFFKGAPLKNWLLYYPVEWFLAHWTDVLITINKEDYRLARKHMHARKVEYIPGVGIDMDRISTKHASRDEVRQGLGINEEDFVLISVGELSKRKNVSIVIRALGKMGNPRIKYLICGSGPEEEAIRVLVKECHLEGSVRLLGFRCDIEDLLGASDLFVFPSLQEGLPVAMMEAIATKTPVICSEIRGNTDLVSERELLFDPNDEESVLRRIQYAMGKDLTAEEERLYEALGKYDLKNVSEIMGREYEQALRMSPEPHGGGQMATYERLTILQELGREQPAYVLLSVGELSDRKNQETAIRALGEMHRTDIVYLIVGTGPLESRFKEMIRKLGLEKQIFLLGQRDDVGLLNDLADIFIHIPVREGLGMAPLEAMAKGLPLVSSYVNGMRDYTLDGITGCCIENPRSVGNVREAISSILESHEPYGRVNQSIAELFSLRRSEFFMRRIYEHDNQ